MSVSFELRHGNTVEPKDTQKTYGKRNSIAHNRTLKIGSELEFLFFRIDLLPKKGKGSVSGSV